MVGPFFYQPQRRTIVPKREVVQSIILSRGVVKSKDAKGNEVVSAKERISLQPGQVFDFTDAELADILQSNPNAVSTTTTVDLSAADDVDLSKVNTQLSSNQAGAPGAAGSANGDL